MALRDLQQELDARRLAMETALARYNHISRTEDADVEWAAYCAAFEAYQVTFSEYAREYAGVIANRAPIDLGGM